MRRSIGLILALFLFIVCIHSASASAQLFPGPMQTPIFNWQSYLNGGWPLPYFFPPSSNHWWSIHYWAGGFNNYGRFTAVPNTIHGLGSGDAVLILPLNLAYGLNHLALMWFQFDMQFNPDGSVLFLIWNVPNCPLTPTYNYDVIGLAYIPGHTYTYFGGIVQGHFQFKINDLTVSQSWNINYTVPDLTPSYDSSCFSPSAAVEGYTSVQSITNVPEFDFAEGNMTSVSYLLSGSGEPNGIQTNATQIGGATSTEWLWQVQPSPLPVPEYPFELTIIGMFISLFIVMCRYRRLKK